MKTKYIDYFLCCAVVFFYGNHARLNEGWGVDEENDNNTNKYAYLLQKS